MTTSPGIRPYGKKDFAAFMHTFHEGRLIESFCIGIFSNTRKADQAIAQYCAEQRNK